ncbi:MAG: ComEC/Rec2 family competence protein [Parcubacteria group bacterium]
MQFTKSQQFFYSCLAFLIGVGLGEVLHWNNIYFLLLAGIVCLSILLMKKFHIAILFVGLIVFGVFWNNLFQPVINNHHFAFYNGQTKTFDAVISAEPSVDASKQQLTVRSREYNGKVLLNLALYPEFNYGDELNVTCRLTAPAQFIDFRYDKYLSRTGIYSVCESAKVRLIATNHGNPLVSVILKIKKSVGVKINSTIAEPEASLLAGILLGSRQNIPPDLMTDFNRAGVTHIIAISGYNITIIVAMLMALARSLSINRKKATWIIVAGLIFFVILTGMSASVLRASVMGMLVVFAKHLGRPSKIRNVLVLSAVLLILFNPRTLIWDAGFQLSFMSTIGLIYLSPLIQRYLKWLPEKFAIQENLSSTLSAIIFTLPIILYSFQRLSLVAPIVNLLILPAIPISMLLGFIQTVCSYVLPFLGSFIGWFTWLLLAYVIKVIETFSSFNFAAVNISVGAWGMVLMYLIIFAVMFLLKRSLPLKLKNPPA